VDLSSYLKKTDLPSQYRTSNDPTVPIANDGWYWLDLVRNWYQGTLPVLYRNRSMWNDVLTIDKVQADALNVTDPDKALVTKQSLNTQLNTQLSNFKPKCVMVTQPEYQSALFVSALVPSTIYYCFPTSGYSTNGSTVTNAVFWISYPILDTIFEVCIVNLSPNQPGMNRTIRIFCETPELQWNAKQYVTFARGRNENAIWSTGYIEPGKALRLVFYPKSTKRFQRNGVDVPGFVEFDEEASESKTLTPVNNT
jgi:hypothetical protein